MKMLGELLKAGSYGEVPVEFCAPDRHEPGRTPALLYAAGTESGPADRIQTLLSSLLVPRGWLLISFRFPSLTAWRQSPTALVALRKIYSHVVRKILIHNKFRPGPLFAGGFSLGARIATHVAREIRFTGLVLLSYPLHPPWRPQLLRHQHLYQLDTPILFLSGTRDPCALPPLIDGVAKRIGDSASLRSLQGVDQDLLTQDANVITQRDLDEQVINELERWMRTTLDARLRHEPGKQ